MSTKQQHHAISVIILISDAGQEKSDAGGGVTGDTNIPNDAAEEARRTLSVAVADDKNAVTNGIEFHQGVRACVFVRTFVIICVCV